MDKIIITGPESSGKTTLCNDLAYHFKLSQSKEYARLYLKKKGKDYTQEDLLIIAKGQLNLEKVNILLDTDLITIKIWSKYKFGNCNTWILDKIEEQKNENRFYLLCKPDIPWESDPLRENPNDRMELFEIYKMELENLGHKYYIVEGKDRLENVIKKIYQLTTLN
tara:strand:+ start:24816 stop:25313 length:498 start_codon:yes stop_codon:yes gene_type:complete